MVYHFQLLQLAHCDYKFPLSLSFSLYIFASEEKDRIQVCGCKLPSPMNPIEISSSDSDREVEGSKELDRASTHTRMLPPHWGSASNGNSSVTLKIPASVLACRM